VFFCSAKNGFCVEKIVFAVQQNKYLNSARAGMEGPSDRWEAPSLLFRRPAKPQLLKTVFEKGRPARKSWGGLG